MWSRGFEISDSVYRQERDIKKHQLGCQNAFYLLILYHVKKVIKTFDFKSSRSHEASRIHNLFALNFWAKWMFKKMILSRNRGSVIRMHYRDSLGPGSRLSREPDPSIIMNFPSIGSGRKWADGRDFFEFFAETLWPRPLIAMYHVESCIRSSPHVRDEYVVQ